MSTPAGRASLFDDYRTDTGRGRYDELLDADGRPRPSWEPLVQAYRHRDRTRLAAAARRLSAAVEDDGVVYNRFDGTTTTTATWTLDPIPLVVGAEEWAELEKGIVQRSMLIDALLTDLYRDQRTIRAGLVPPEMVFGHPGYLRKASRLKVSGPHSLFLHGVDLGRLADGRWAVHADRTQAPSGIGYALVDRALLARTLPQTTATMTPRSHSGFIAELRLSLQEYAPAGVSDPTVAVLTAGTMSETAFDQSHLASTLGFPLVEGSDLTVVDGMLFMRSLGRLERVDVLLRRIDAEFADPLDLRTDSRLGVVGLVEAISRGNVTVVNTLGSGVTENPALHTVYERLAPFLLDEDLLLPSVPTLWAGDVAAREEIVADLDDMLVTDVRTGVEHNGALLDEAGRVALVAEIVSHGTAFSARRLQQWSQAPTMIDDGTMTDGISAAGVCLRAFSLARGNSYTVMPGGLGSVLAPGPAGAALDASAAKDVWVGDAEVGGHESRIAVTTTPPPGPATLGPSASVAVSPRVLSDLFWFGRYSERVESVTRIARVIAERCRELESRPWAAGGDALPILVRAAGQVTGTAGHLDAVSGQGRDAAESAVLRLTSDRFVPGTIAYGVDRLVHVVRALRDQMSTSTWMVLAPLEHAVARPAARTVPGAGVDEPLDALEQVHDEILHATLALTGLQAESMIRDAGWHLSDLGRRVERMITLAGLLSSSFTEEQDPDVEQVLLDAQLVAAESRVTYRRRNRGLLRLTAVTELLVFDETNPRSLIFGAAALRDDLGALPEEIRSVAAERMAEDLITALRRADPAGLSAVDDGRRPSLQELMTTVADTAREISDHLEHTRFTVPHRFQPIWGAGEGSA